MPTFYYLAAFTSGSIEKESIEKNLVEAIFSGIFVELDLLVDGVLTREAKKEK